MEGDRKMCGLWPVSASYLAATALTAASPPALDNTHTLPPDPPPVILAPYRPAAGPASSTSCTNRSVLVEPRPQRVSASTAEQRCSGCSVHILARALVDACAWACHTADARSSSVCISAMTRRGADVQEIWLWRIISPSRLRVVGVTGISRSFWKFCTLVCS
jgi:hypothetical protein